MKVGCIVLVTVPVSVLLLSEPINAKGIGKCIVGNLANVSGG